jgi:hypothetical protein
VGHLLRVRCFPVPSDASSLVELTSPVAVSPLPLADGEVFPFEKRQLLTPGPCSAEEGHFRVTSYNLLADFYSDSDFSRTSLFAHCPAKVNAEIRGTMLKISITG